MIAIPSGIIIVILLQYRFGGFHLPAYVLMVFLVEVLLWSMFFYKARDSQEMKNFLYEIIGNSQYVDYMGEAENEITTGSRDKNLWAQSLIKSKGNEERRKAIYIKLRSKQLYKTNRDRL